MSTTHGTPTVTIAGKSYTVDELIQRLKDSEWDSAPPARDSVRAIVREELEPVSHAIASLDGLAQAMTDGQCAQFATLRGLRESTDSLGERLDSLREALDPRVSRLIGGLPGRSGRVAGVPFGVVIDHTSPSAGGCGDHSVGDGPVAGADSAVPAAEANARPAGRIPYRLLIVAASEDVRAITHAQVIALGCQAVVSLADIAGDAGNLRGLYDGASIDSRLAGSARLQRILDQLFPPGERYRAQFIPLATVAPVPVPGPPRSQVLLDGARATVMMETLPGKPRATVTCTTPALRRLHEVLGRAVAHLDRFDADAAAEHEAGE